MKCLLKLVTLVVLVLALLVGGLFLMINPLIETAVSEGVGYTTQQDTTLESADLGIFSGDMSFEGLEIANPPGFQETPLLKLGRFQTALSPAGLSEDVIALDVVELDGLDLALEIKGTETNITKLVERLQDLQEQMKSARGVDEGGESSSETPKESMPAEAGPAIKINRIRIAGVSANLRISEIPLAEGVYGFTVPDMELQDFDSSMDGATMVEWTAHVLEEVIAASLTAAELELPSEVSALLQNDLFKNDVLGGLLEGNLDELGDKLEDKAKETLEDMLEGAKEDPAGEINKAIDDLKEGANALDSLFGGDDD